MFDLLGLAGGGGGGGLVATTTTGMPPPSANVMNNAVAVISKPHQPDLITDMKDIHHHRQPQLQLNHHSKHNHGPHGSNGSAGGSANSQVSSQGSYKMAMENIIVDYR